MTERVLVVHTHPGDETVFTGATIATLLERNAEVTVVTVARHGDPAVLARALEALGSPNHRYLGQLGARRGDREPRAYLPSAGNRHPDSLAESSAASLVDDLVAVILDVQPTVVLGWGDHDGLSDPDRGRVFDALVEATRTARVALYVRAATGTVRVEPASVAELRTRALDAHGLPHEAAAGDETFRRHRSRGNGFAAQSIVARALTAVLALGLGGLVGVTLTFVHQSTLEVGSTIVPWGIIIAVVIVTALFVGLRLVFDTRIVPGFAAVGVLGASALLALPNTSGTVLVPGNTAGYVWTFAPVVVAALVLAWPRFTQPTAGKIATIPTSKGSDLP